MRFGEVIDDAVKYGYTVRRECWEDGFYVGFRLPDDRSDLTGAYFYISGTHHGELVTVPWTPDTFDMTAHDWVILK